MGVKGLATYIRNNIPFPPSNFSLEGCTLLVDGSGLVFHLQDLVTEPILSDGGNYAQFHKTLSKWVHSMMERKMKLVVYFDGPKRLKFKDGERKARLEKKQLLWGNLKSWGDEGYVHTQDTHEPNVFPLPVLLFNQCRVSLVALGVTIVDVS